jgi:mRNA-degrading endonuclease RelE of RelBE toxin-antitoxin system
MNSWTGKGAATRVHSLGSTECRFRVGDHRVIYEFDAQKNVIHVLAVGNRDKIYKSR